MDDFDAKSLELVATECPGFQARAMARTLTRYYNTRFKPLGLTAEQFGLLVGIGTTESCTVVDLATSAGVDATTLSRNVQNLQARGLIHTEGGRGRAGKRLHLTSSGRLLMTKALPVWESAKAELSQHMGEQPLRSAITAMTELRKAAASRE